MPSYTFKKRAFFCAVLIAALVSATLLAQAQQAVLKWEKFQGQAADVAVGANGAVAVIDVNGQVYQYINDGWSLIGKRMSRIAADVDGTFWGVDNTGALRRFSGTSWNAVGNGAQDVAVGLNNEIYVTTNKNLIARYDVSAAKWASVKGTAARIAIDNEGIIWSVASDGSIARILDGAHIGVSGSAKDITADKNGRVLIAGLDGKLYRWNNQETAWILVPSPENIQAVSSGDGQVWIAQDNNRIYALGASKRRKSEEESIDVSEGGGGSSDPSEAIDDSPIIFEPVPDSTAMVQLSIGRDGSVYALDSSGNIYRWSNTEQRFYDFPGTVNDIAIKDNGLPFAIGTSDNLIEHDGEAWRQVNLALELADISLFGDLNKMLAISSNEQAVRMSDNYLAYTQLPKQGEVIEAAPNGSFWIIDEEDRLFRCEAESTCERQNLTARDISIGPGGSVFVVDGNGSLYRYNKNDGTFEKIAVPVSVGNVAAGPQDRPWIIDVSGQVYQSGYFERDETFDRTLATKTTATESVTSEEPNVDGSNSGIQIVQNVSFTQVVIPTTSTNYPNLGSGMLDITSGQDDIVIATGFSEPCTQGTGRNWIYNPNSRSFTYLDILGRINLFSGIAAGRLSAEDLSDLGVTASDTDPDTTPDMEAFYGLWDKNCTEPALIFYAKSIFEEQQAAGTHNYDDAIFDSPLVNGPTADIDVAANGIIAYVDNQNEVEYFDPANEQDFSRRSDLDFLRIGIGADENDVWVTNTANNVYQYNQNTDSFDLRSVNADDKAQDIGVGQNGSVYIVNLNGVLKKWDALSKRFIKTNKANVTRVAVDSRGNPIVGNFPSSQIVYFGR